MKKTAKKLMQKKAAVSLRTKSILKKGRKKMQELRPAWERAKKKLEATAEAAGKGAERAVEKTVTMATLAGLKLKARRSRQDLQEQFADLGGWVYELAKRNPQALSPTDPEIIGMIVRIREKEQEIADLEEKAKSLRK